MDQALLGRLQQHLASGGQLSELLPDLDPANPAVGLVSQLLARRQQQLEAQLEQAPPEDDGQIQRQIEQEAQRQAESLYQEDRRRRRMESLHRQFDEMNSELEWSRELLAELALALGACPACWGQDDRCRWCRGRGRPGLLSPDPEAFNRYVSPVLRRLPGERARPHQVPPDQMKSEQAGADRPRSNQPEQS